MAANAVSVVLGFSAYFPAPVSNVPVVNDVAEEDGPYYLQFLPSRDKCRYFALQRVQKSCKIHGLAVPLVVWFVQQLTKESLVVSASD